jgi:hypothetical protein
MIRMLDKRAQLLLKTLIERYIEEGQPVGSRTLSKHSGIDLSPAAVDAFGLRPPILIRAAWRWYLPA